MMVDTCTIHYTRSHSYPRQTVPLLRFYSVLRGMLPARTTSRPTPVGGMFCLPPVRSRTHHSCRQ